MNRAIEKLTKLTLLIASLFSLYWVIHPHTPSAKSSLLILDVTQVSRATHVFFLVFAGYLLSYKKPRSARGIGGIILILLSLVPLLAFLKLKLHIYIKIAAIIIWFISFGPAVIPNLRPVFDLSCAFLSVVPYLYQVFTFEKLIERAMAPEQVDLLMGFALVYLLNGIVYRFNGPVLPILVMIFFSYDLHGRLFPEKFAHAPFPVDLLIGKLYCETEAGLFGIITGVSMKYLVYFTILGGIVSALNLGKVVANIACAGVGRGPNAPVRALSISSIFMGMFSGSGAADTQFVSTISKPMFEKTGYNTYVAAGIAATAGTIAMVTPPILGSMAFIMVEILSIPYLWICIMALGPMLMYLVAILGYGHFYTKRENIKELAETEIVGKKYVVRYLYIFLPLLVIIGFIYFGYPVNLSVTIAIIMFVVFAYIDKSLRPASFRSVLKGLEDGFAHLVPIGIAVVSANIIMTLMVLTGLPSKFSQFLLQLSAENILVATLFAAIFTLIMGMGVPPTATYVISSSLTAPAIHKLAVANGIPPEAALLATHMFLMYYAILADVTPPVALSAYASASVFNTHPVRTGIYAAKVALPKYLFGFSFILSYSGTALLVMPMVIERGIAGSVLEIAIRTVVVMLAVIFMSSATVGYSNRRLKRYESYLLGLFSLGLFYPNTIANIVCFFPCLWFFLSGNKKERG